MSVLENERNKSTINHIRRINLYQAAVTCNPIQIQFENHLSLIAGYNYFMQFLGELNLE